MVLERIPLTDNECIVDVIDGAKSYKVVPNGFGYDTLVLLPDDSGIRFPEADRLKVNSEWGVVKVYHQADGATLEQKTLIAGRVVKPGVYLRAMTPRYVSLLH